jgi:hypothetical protein
MKCPRVQLRMECLECGYPYSEAMLPLDPRVPHVDENQTEPEFEDGHDCEGFPGGCERLGSCPCADYR